MKTFTCPLIPFSSQRVSSRWMQFIVTGVLSTASIHSVRANTVTWNLASNGFWDVGSNWTGSQTPNLFDDVVNSSKYTITLNNTNDPTAPEIYQAESLSNTGTGEFLVNNSSLLEILGNFENSSSTIEAEGLFSTIDVFGGMNNVGKNTNLLAQGATINLYGSQNVNSGGAEINAKGEYVSGVYLRGEINLYNNEVNANFTNSGSEVQASSGSIINLSSDISNVQGGSIYAKGVVNIGSTYHMQSLINMGSSKNIINNITNDNSSILSSNGAQINIWDSQILNQNQSYIQADGTGTQGIININTAGVKPDYNSTLVNDNSFVKATNGGLINLYSTFIDNKQSGRFSSNNATLNIGINGVPLYFTNNGSAYSVSNHGLIEMFGTSFLNTNSTRFESINANDGTLLFGSEQNPLNLFVNENGITNQNSELYGVQATNGSSMQIFSNNLNNQNGGNIIISGKSTLHLGDSKTPIALLNNSNNGGHGISVEQGSSAVIYAAQLKNSADSTISVSDSSLSGNPQLGSSLQIFGNTVTNDGQGSSIGAVNDTTLGITLTDISSPQQIISSFNNQYDANLYASASGQVTVNATIVNNFSNASISSIGDVNEPTQLNITAGSIFTNNHANAFAFDQGTLNISSPNSILNQNGGIIDTFQSGNVNLQALYIANETGGSIFADGTNDSGSVSSPLVSNISLMGDPGALSLYNNNASIYSVGGGNVETNSSFLTNTNGGQIYASGQNPTTLASSITTLTSFSIQNDSSQTNNINNSSIYAANGGNLNIFPGPQTAGLLLNENGGQIYSTGKGSKLNIGSASQPFYSVTTTGAVGSIYNDASASSISALKSGYVNIYASNINLLSGGNLTSSGLNSVVNLGSAKSQIGTVTVSGSNSVTGPSQLLSTQGGIIQANADVFNIENGGKLVANTSSSQNIISNMLNIESGASIQSNGPNISSLFPTINIQTSILAVNSGYINASGSGIVNISTSTFTNSNNSLVTITDPASELNMGTVTAPITRFQNNDSQIQIDNGASAFIQATNLNNTNDSTIVAETQIGYSGIPPASLTIDTINLLNDASYIGSLDGTTTTLNVDGTLTNQNSSEISANAINSSVFDYPGGTLNIQANTINNTTQSIIGTNNTSTLNLDGYAFNNINGGIVSDNGKSMSIGTPLSPFGALSDTGWTLVNGSPLYSNISVSSGANLDIWSNQITIADGASLTESSGFSNNPSSMNMGDPTHFVNTLSLSGASLNNPTSIDIKSGILNAWVNTVNLVGSTGITSSGIVNIGDSNHLVNSIALNGNGFTASLIANDGQINLNTEALTNQNGSSLLATGKNGYLNVYAKTSITNDGTSTFSTFSANQGGTVNISSTLFSNQNGGIVTTASGTINLGSSSQQLGTFNNFGNDSLFASTVAALNDGNININAVNINNTCGGMLLSNTTQDILTPTLNLGSQTHFVNILNNSGSGHFGASSIIADSNASVNITANTLNNSQGAVIGSNQNSNAKNGGTLQIIATSLNNSSGAVLYSSGASSQTNIYAKTLNNDANINALNGSNTTLETTSFDNSTNGNLHADNGSTLVLYSLTPVNDSGSIQIDNGGSISMNNTLNIKAGTTSNNGDLVAPAINLTGGVLNGSHGTFGVSKLPQYVKLTQTGGIFNPGEDPGHETLNGSYNLSGGTYQLDLASPTSFDVLNVTGGVNIHGGILSLDFLNNYIPAGGGTYHFLLSNSYGSTDSFNSIKSNLTGKWNFNYSQGTVAILADSPPPPDVPETRSILTFLSLMGLSGAAVRGRKRVKH